MSEVHYSRGVSAPRRLFLAIPTYTGTLPARVVMVLTQSMCLLQTAGYRVDLCIESGNCHVDDTRNSLVRQFLLSECDEMLFVDADVAWRPDELMRFLSHDRDVVAGVYPKKRDGEDYPVRELGGALISDDAGLVEVDGVPTGFLRLSRSCIERMAAACDKTYHGSQGEKDGEPYRIIFERTWEPLEGEDYGLRYGGDYSFCRKWRALGGAIYVDPEMTFDHEGAHRWTGCLANFWRERSGAETDKIVAAMDAVLGDLTDANLDALIEAWGNPVWTATRELLLACIDEARNGQGPILECGSGLTTLVMAAFGERPILALEHDPKWAELTASRLNACDLGGPDVRIVCAPIEQSPDGDVWYDHQVESASTVVVDGPPREFGREGVVSQIRRLAPDVVILDDQDDQRQRDLAEIVAAHMGTSIETTGKVATLRTTNHLQAVNS